MSIKLLSLVIFSLLLLSFSSKAADKNYPSFITASKVTIIDDELGKAKNFDDLHIVLIKMREIVLRSFGDTCNPPTEADIRLWCGDIVTKSKVYGEEAEFYDYLYEKRLWQMACVDAKNDSEETIKKKIVAWWNKYKLDCYCNSPTFGVPNGGILKFAISQRHIDFIRVLANYDLDINFIDPANNNNLLDYLNEEIAKIRLNGSSSTTIEIYEKYKRTLISLGAKPSK